MPCFETPVLWMLLGHKLIKLRNSFKRTANYIDATVYKDTIYTTVYKDTVYTTVYKDTVS